MDERYYESYRRFSTSFEVKDDVGNGNTANDGPN